MFQNAEAQNSEIDIDRYNNIIFSLLTNFNSIIGNNQNSKLVYEAFTVSKNAIDNKEVTFLIDLKQNRILSGMSFGFSESGEINLIFGKDFLDTYKSNSSIHYSILIHEYRHLHDYLTNKSNYIKVKTDEKEKYLYELDALRIEAEFIKYYLVGKYNLSSFEEFVLRSFEDDNLNSASIFILKEGMNMFFWFDDREMKYQENNILREKILNELEQNGNMLVSSYHVEKEEHNGFAHFIDIITFRRYMIRIMKVMNVDPKITWEDLFIQYPKIGKIYKEASIIIDTDIDKQNQYINSVIQNWETDIKDRH
jgi:hypothetical protein